MTGLSIVAIKGGWIAVTGATMMEFLGLMAMTRTLGPPVIGVPVARLHDEEEIIS